MSTPRSEGLATTGRPAADAATGVNRQAIVSIDALIRPYLRRTPVIQVDRADFGLPPGPLVLKIELLQASVYGNDECVLAQVACIRCNG